MIRGYMTDLDEFFNEINNGKHTNKLLVSYFGSHDFFLAPKSSLDRYLNDERISMIIDGANGNLITGDEI